MIIEWIVLQKEGGKISRMTLKELKQIKLENGQEIPTLEEFIERVNKPMNVFLTEF